MSSTRLINANVREDNDLDLMKMYESTFSKFLFKVEEGQVVEGQITEISKKDNIAFVDFNYRQMGLLDLSKESSKISIGDKLSFIIKYIKGEELYLSCDEYKRTILNQQLMDNIEYNRQFIREIDPDQADNINFFEGIVTEIWNQAGFVVDIGGIDCFMPGSLADINKMFDFSQLLGEKVMVAPVNFDKGNIIVSRKLYLHTLVPKEIKKLEAGIGKEMYDGIVTGSSSYGVFVKFNGLLTGMIYHSELEGQDKIDFDNGMITDGSTIRFKVKFIQKGTKIVLTQKKEDSWNISIKKYSVGDKIKVTVLKDIDKGYLVAINPDIRGLVKTKLKYLINDTIDTTITAIDLKAKKVFLEEIPK